jgi:hypothetical protein
VRFTSQPSFALLLQSAYPALHVYPQLVPLHVGCALAGVGHGVHDVPHELIEPLLSHALPHWW